MKYLTNNIIIEKQIKDIQVIVFFL